MDCGFLWILSSSLQGSVMHTYTPGRRQRTDDNLRAEWVTQKPCALGRHFLTLWPNTWGNKTFLLPGFIVAEEWHITVARKWRWLHILCPLPFIPSEPKYYLESPRSHRGTPRGVLHNLTSYFSIQTSWRSGLAIIPLSHQTKRS